MARISGLVFTNDGKRITDSVKDREMRALCQAQRIEDFRFHDLRHSAVTNLRNAGVPIETIMKIVGHASVEMFLRYRAVDDAELDAAMAQLEAHQNTRSRDSRTPIGHQPKVAAAISAIL